MFTEAEFHALTASLSNDSRVLYCLGLRPTVDVPSALSEPVNYKYLINLVNGNNTEDGDYSRGQQINTLLGELEQAGLIALQDDNTLETSLSGQRLLLPLCNGNQDNFTHLHRQYTAIHGRWRPDPALFEEMAISSDSSIASLMTKISASLFRIGWAVQTQFLVIFNGHRNSPTQ